MLYSFVLHGYCVYQADLSVPEMHRHIDRERIPGAHGGTERHLQLPCMIALLTSSPYITVLWFHYTMYNEKLEPAVTL